ncbi:EamA family transporter [Capillimicrobium parvum]|uniref:EamA domain-containing protein n=1 Tax=Capillimicrobium parvum TaxID=2884022 RepID=A0A9E7C065_9ACTN|nr:EamA family transporter [Capillimicrobium parvum]UGS35068.1 hypothetical protein DSM104329_01452 [Capillimicrobium parvum]
MLAILLALGASGCWGIADFGAGLASRRLAVPVVLLVLQAGGLLAAGAIVAVDSDALPSAHVVAMSLAAGTASVVALTLFYRALAVGTMSIVAPLVSTGAIVPVVVGIWRGDSLGPATAAGIGLALVGVMMASRGQRGARRPARARAAIVLALAAAVAFGSFLALFERANAAEGIAWPILLARLPAIPLMGAVLLVRTTRLPTRREFTATMMLGQLDCVAVALYGAALTHGELGVVAVVGSLYPVGTVLMARAVLGERLARVQGAGVATALLGVALLSAGAT